MAPPRRPRRPGFPPGLGNLSHKAAPLMQNAEDLLGRKRPVAIGPINIGAMIAPQRDVAMKRCNVPDRSSSH